MTDEILEKLIEINDEKISKIKPQNIKNGVTIFDVTGTYEGNDITMNVFVQETEPIVKKGLWFEIDETAEHYNFEPDVYIANEWLPSGSKRVLPDSSLRQAAATIGTNVYLFGGTLAYKYDTLTNNYTQLANIPFSFSGGAEAIGTDIYLFSGTTAYKYNTLTDTYTQLTNPPVTRISSASTTVGTDIYLFGTNSQGANKYSYKYDTLANVYTRLADTPVLWYGGTAVTIGNYIYLLGSSFSGENYKLYRYNIATNNYTRLTDMPIAYPFGKAVDTDVYMFRGTSSYKYDTLTDTYTQLTNVPYSFTTGSRTIVDTNIYLIDGTRIQVYALKTKQYEDNSVVVLQGRHHTTDYGYEIELFTNAECSIQALYPVNNAWFYTIQDGLITDIPTYYGNGNQWIKFKN